ALRAEPQLGIASLPHAYPDGRPQRSGGDSLGLRALLGEALGFDRVDLSGWAAARGFVEGTHGSSRELEWVQGSFLVVRSAVIEATGAFDPEFFLYGEDMEWCYRVRQAGWR